MANPVKKILGNGQYPAYVRATTIASEYGLSPRQKNIFVAFVKESDTFKGYTSDDYLAEWARAFAASPNHVRVFQKADLSNQRILARLDPDGYSNYRRWLG